MSSSALAGYGKYSDNVYGGSGGVRGLPILGAQVTVYSAGTTSLVTIYKDVAGLYYRNQTTDPILTDSEGYFEFYAPNGSYDLKISISGFAPRTISGIEIAYNSTPNQALTVYIGQYASIEDFLSQTTTSTKTLIVDEPTTLTTGTVIPATVSIEVRYPGKITVASGSTLTINGPFSAGLYTALSTTGNVFFADSSAVQIYPQWFGAVVDGVTDDTVAFQTAITSAVISGKPIIVTGALASGAVVVPKTNNHASTFILRGVANWFFGKEVPASRIISLAGSDDLISFEYVGVFGGGMQYVELSNIALYGPDITGDGSHLGPTTHTSGNGFNALSSERYGSYQFTNVYVFGFGGTGKAGILLGEGYYNNFTNVNCTFNYYGMVVDSLTHTGGVVGFNGVVMNGCAFRQNSKIGLKLWGVESFVGNGNVIESNDEDGLLMSGCINHSWNSTYFENNNYTETPTGKAIRVYSEHAAGNQHVVFNQIHLSGPGANELRNNVEVGGNGTGASVDTQFNGGYASGHGGMSTEKLFTLGTRAYETKITDVSGIDADLGNVSDSGLNTRIRVFDVDKVGQVDINHRVVSETISSATYTIDMSLGDTFFIICSSNSISFAAPVNYYQDRNGTRAPQRLTLSIANNVGGGFVPPVMNSVFRLAGAPNFPTPSYGYFYTIVFQYVNSAWREISRSGDVPYN